MAGSILAQLEVCFEPFGRCYGIPRHLQDMLVILCQRPWTYNIAVITGLSRVNVDNTYDASCSGLNGDAASLIKLVPVRSISIRSFMQHRS